MQKTSPTPPPAVRRATRTQLWMLVLAGLGMGVSLGFALDTLLPLDATALGLLGLAQSLSAVAGTYLTLVLLTLAARIPLFESALGQDRLISIHRKIGPWAVYLVAFHVLGVVYQQGSYLDRNWFAQLYNMATTQPWIMAALVAIVLFIVVGLTSWKRIHNRLPRGVWWTIHLYAYLGIALAFVHQIVSGGPFIDGWGMLWWIALYVLVFAAILIWRVGLPLTRTLGHSLRVQKIVQEGPDVYSVWISGKHLQRWGAQPGQFLNLRFFEKDLFWEAHPYSLSAPVQDNLLRVTIKDLGDASHLTASLQPGTRVWVEGPYGVMTPDRCASDHAVLIGAGIGITPMRAVAEGLMQQGKQVDLLVRAHSEADVLLGKELEALNQLPGLNVRLLVGTRQQHPLNASHLRQLVPSISQSDLYACGPSPLLHSLEDDAVALGIPQDRIHIEHFTI